jgi:hypothetical protein
MKYAAIVVVKQQKSVLVGQRLIRLNKLHYLAFFIIGVFHASLVISFYRTRSALSGLHSKGKTSKTRHLKKNVLRAFRIVRFIWLAFIVMFE